MNRKGFVGYGYYISLFCLSNLCDIKIHTIASKCKKHSKFFLILTNIQGFSKQRKEKKKLLMKMFSLTNQAQFFLASHAIDMKY